MSEVYENPAELIDAKITRPDGDKSDKIISVYLHVAGE